MPRSADALVTSSVLRWAREDAGYEVEEAARKVSVKPAKLESWEAGEARPTIKQARKLAQAYKRPLGVFFLLEPPTSFQAMQDFRRLPVDRPRTESPCLRLAIRQARHLREVALSLAAGLGEDLSTWDLRADRTTPAEALARSIREELGVPMQDQTSWYRKHEALKGWRRALEDRGMLVYQMSGVEMNEARAFSLAELPLPVVAINSNDAPAGRVFSMLHELAHVALRAGGLCDLHTAPGEAEDLEAYCNHVAGAVLVPAGDLLATPIVQAHGGDPRWAEEDLTALANQFSVSREVILRRLLILERTTLDFYRQQRDRYVQEYNKLLDRGTGGPTWDVRTISRVGERFARLALESFYQERITLADLTGYFGVKFQHLPKIEQAIFGRAIAFEASGLRAPMIGRPSPSSVDD